MLPSREQVHALLAKYRELLRLRLLHEAGDEPFAVRDRARLAATFPGALRELDALSTAELYARVAALSAASADGARGEPWMTALALYHHAMREVLVAKRWLARKREVTAEVRAAFTAAHPEEARTWGTELHRVAEPPRGRVTELVVERVAKALEIPAKDARALLFGRRGS